jgi:hypothetical protein
MTQAPPSSPRSIVVFDLGGVLIDWSCSSVTTPRWSIS